MEAWSHNHWGTRQVPGAVDFRCCVYPWACLPFLNVPKVAHLPLRLHLSSGLLLSKAELFAEPRAPLGLHKQLLCLEALLAFITCLTRTCYQASTFPRWFFPCLLPRPLRRGAPCSEFHHTAHPRLPLPATSCSHLTAGSSSCLESIWKALRKYVADSLTSWHLDVTALMLRGRLAELETGTWDLTRG